MSGQNVGHLLELKENLVNTLDATIFVRMFVLMISRPSLNMGHIGLKTRSLDQIEGIGVKTLEAAFFTLSKLKLCQNVCLDDI